MSGMYGADVAELRSLAQRFDQAASRLESHRSTVTGVLANTLWRGTDASLFRSVWNADHGPRVTAAARSLRDAAQSLQRNADQQEQASAVDQSGVSNPVFAAGLSATALLGGGLSLLRIAKPFWDAYDNVHAVVTTVNSSLGTAFLAAKTEGLSMKSSLSTLEHALGFSKSESLFPDGLSKAFRISDKVDGLLSGGRVLGKALGGVGVVFGVMDTIDRVDKGDTWGAIASSTATILGAAALVPTPASPFLGAAAAAISVGQLIADHHEEIGHAIGTAATAVAHAAAETTGFIADIAGQAKKVWPWL